MACLIQEDHVGFRVEPAEPFHSGLDGPVVSEPLSTHGDIIHGDLQRGQHDAFTGEWIGHLYGFRIQHLATLEGKLVSIHFNLSHYGLQ